MVKKSKISKKISRLKKYLKKIKPIKKVIVVSAIAAIFLLILVGLLFLCVYILKPNHYSINNGYYSFSLKTSKDWVAKENTLFSKDSIYQVVSNSDKSGDGSVTEIGAFRFFDKKYPDEFINSGNSAVILPSGGILEINVYYFPAGNEDNVKIANYVNNQPPLDLKALPLVKNFSILEGKIGYEVNEYVYISPADKKNGDKIKQDYVKVFDKIISSFKFI
jgi:hypothetical protein